MVTLFRRFVAVALGLAGLVFTLVGAVQLKDQTWPAATGTVQSCTVETTTAGAKSRTRNVYTCVVGWDADKTYTLALPLSLAAPGCPVDLRVNGDRAALAMPAWRAALPAAIGAAMIGAAGFLFFRTRRRPVAAGVA